MAKNIGYEIKIVKAKTRTGEQDLKKPYETKDKKGFFFMIQYLALKQVSENGVNVRRQRKPYTEVIFNNGNTEIVFNDITSAIAAGAFKEDPTGVTIHTGEMGFEGQIVEEDCGFIYTVMNGDGTAVKVSSGPNAGKDTTRSVVRVFVPDDEDKDTVIAKAIARIPITHRLKATANEEPIVEEP